MNERFRQAVTPQQKIIAVNNKFGNNDIKNQQGTSRILYDTLPAGTNTTFRFFEDSAARVFPFCNTGSEGNKLGVGDSMVIQAVMFTVFDVTNIPGGPIINEWNFVQPLVDMVQSFNLAYFNFQLANNQVIKKLTLSEANSQFNKDYSATNKALDLETNIVIPPLLPFVLELRLPQSIPVAPPSPTITRYVECQLIGTGGIIAPRATF
jgi:hypothetical protein